jgi:hypothetical protein
MCLLSLPSFLSPFLPLSLRPFYFLAKLEEEGKSLLRQRCKKNGQTGEGFPPAHLFPAFQEFYGKKREENLRYRRGGKVKTMGERGGKQSPSL